VVLQNFPPTNGRKKKYPKNALRNYIGSDRTPKEERCRQKTLLNSEFVKEREISTQGQTPGATVKNTLR